MRDSCLWCGAPLQQKRDHCCEMTVPGKARGCIIPRMHIRSSVEQQAHRLLMGMLCSGHKRTVVLSVHIRSPVQQ